MEAAKKQHEMAKTLTSAMEKAKSMRTCVLTTLIIIDVELPIDHHRPILHHHQRQHQWHGRASEWSLASVPSLKKLHREDTVGAEA